MHRRRFISAALILPFLSFRALTSNKPPNPGIRLFIIGDWGTGGRLQKRVAMAMQGTAARQGSPTAIVSTGDNFYPDGVESATDPQFKTKFENIYTGADIASVPWVVVLGNHDHRKNIMAQVEYGKRNDKWVMPAPYFSHRIKGADETTLSLLCLDTQQVLKQSSGWKDQIAWLKDELPRHRTSDWIVAVGHHPMRSYGHYGDQAFMLNAFKQLFDDNGVHAYFCGHDHDLQIIKHPEDEFHCIVSGGGGGSRKSNSGKYTLASSTNGGFMHWYSTKLECSVEMIGPDGEIRNKVNMSKGTQSK